MEEIMLRTGTFVGDRYEILGKIGSGGMSDVYKAKCHKLNRLVAIKVLKQEFCSNRTFVTRFKVEAQAAAKLTHPNIVAIYDVGDEGDLHYIVMELVDGITLKEYISRKGRLENRETIGIGIQVAQGLEAAHAQSIVHRDIKPQNIIISREGKVKVMDFGIAKAVTGDTINSEAIGSVHYISPEQARGGYCDSRSDIYSLGITLYEMLTGVVPYDGENTVSVALAHIQGEMIPPRRLVSSITPSLEKIILKCTQKAPEHRYHTATELITDLRKALVMPDGDFVVLTPAAAAAAGTAQAASDPILPVPDSAETDSFSSPQTEGQDFGYNETDDSLYTDLFEEDEDPDGDSDDDYFGVIPPEEEEDKPSAGDRAAFVISIVLAVIIFIMAVYLIGRLTGLIKTGSKKNNNTTTTETETLPEGKTRMPDLINLTEDEAREALNECGLGMSVEYDSSETIKEGRVMMQEYEENEIIDKNIKVVVTISTGSNMVEIPSDIIGKTQSQAESVLKSLNLDEKGIVVTYTQQYSDTYDVGVICGMMPATGLVKQGGTLILYVSQGQQVKPIKMPDVTNQNASQAKSQLEALELYVVLVEQSDDTVQAGLVISQSIAKDTQVTPGTTVTLTVSTGKESVKVPNLVELTQEEAESQLEELGILYSVTTTTVTDSSKVGIVQSQSIAKDTVYGGEELVITVGAQKNETVLPVNLVPGVTESDARNSIDSLNMDLKIDVKYEYSETAPAGIVLQVYPQAGSTVSRGSTVTLVVSQGKKPAETNVPDPTDPTSEPDSEASGS